jgi:hypothetical protein
MMEGYEGKCYGHSENGHVSLIALVTIGSNRDHRGSCAESIRTFLRFEYVSCMYLLKARRSFAWKHVDIGISRHVPWERRVCI